MNFIKKKIKGSKKTTHAPSEEDEDFDAAFVHAVRPECTPKGWVPYEERVDEKSEEWLAFKKLTERVSETIHKTQDNLTKIVAESAVPEVIGEPPKFEVKEVEAVVAESQVSGKTPPRPPLPKTDAPARPPSPPKAVTAVDDLLGLYSGISDSDGINGYASIVEPIDNFSLVGDFGFGSETAPTQVEGYIDTFEFESFTDEGNDPFDTSFVNVSATTKNGLDTAKNGCELDDFFSGSNADYFHPTASENLLFGEESDKDDDPFTYPDDIGTVKRASIQSSGSITNDSKMNIFPQVRAKSPNPFLNDATTSSSPSSLNPFLTGMDSALTTDRRTSMSNNPFLSNDTVTGVDLFDLGTESNQHQVPSQGLDLFSEFISDHVQKKENQSSNVAFDFFDTSVPQQNEGHSAVSLLDNLMAGGSTQSQPPVTSHADDLFNLMDTTNDSFSSKTENIMESSMPRKPSVQMESNMGATNEIDFFGSSTVSRSSIDMGKQESPLDSGSIFDASVVSSRKQSVSSSRKASIDMSQRQSANTSGIHGIDFIGSTETSNDFSFMGTQNTGAIPPVDLNVQVVDMSKVQSDFDSFFESRRSSASITAKECSVDPLDAFSVTQPTMQTSAQKDVFDMFDSIPSQPINASDGLVPRPPRIKIEIPLELKQNADVLELLGQKGPKTPIEPLTGFDLPTPNPEDEAMFGLGSDLPVLGMPEFDAESLMDEPTEKITAPVDDEPQDTEQEIAQDLPEPEETIPISTFEQPATIDDAFESFPVQNIPEEDTEQEDTSENAPFSASEQATFDAFEARFESASVTTENQGEFDPFGGLDTAFLKSNNEGFGENKAFGCTEGFGDTKGFGGTEGFGDTKGFGGTEGFGDTKGFGGTEGFGGVDEFDPFLTMVEPPAPPQPSPARFAQKEDESDSDDNGPDFSVFIRPKMKDPSAVAEKKNLAPLPLLPPPPKSPIRSPAHTSPTPRFNPFDKNQSAEKAIIQDEDFFPKPEVPDLSFAISDTTAAKKDIKRTESEESVGTPLFEEDTSQPLKEFPAKYAGDGWDLMLRQPNKKKITGQRFWKKIFLRLSDHVLHLFHSREDKDPFQELPLQACYSLSEVCAQQFDQYGKIFTVKLQYIFYRERVGVRPAQITKVAQGQITSFGQLAKLGLPLEHAPQVSQLLKLGTQTYADIKIFVQEIEDALFRLNVHRDRALTYKTEEIQVTVQDETYCDVSKTGHVNEQLARVRIFFLAFISNMPNVEVGINDRERRGKEIVGRHDIIPIVTEEWIRLEDIELHSCVDKDEFEKTKTIKLHPPDACFFELLRFRVRPPKNRELPLQIKVVMTVEGNKVEIRSDILVPGFSSRKHGQIPCEDVAIRFPVPECWIYLFRVEKHFRYGSLKSAARKPGKIKGLERFMGAATTLDPSLIEVSTGAAKYEHHHHAIVWRMPRLPKEGQGAYTEHSFVCRLELTSYDQMPEEHAKYVYVEFSMPATTVSHCVCRSVSVSNPTPPEKHVKNISRHEYRVEIEHVSAFAENVYVAATATAASAARKASVASSSPSDS